MNILKAINVRREQKTTEMYTLFVSITVSIKINIMSTFNTRCLLPFSGHPAQVLLYKGEIQGGYCHIIW